MKKLVLLLVGGILLGLGVRLLAQTPNCAGTEQWPTNMAFVNLKNAGLTNNDKLDFTKTKTERIASEEIRKGIFRQVHHVTFREKSGRNIEAITVNLASNSECSESGVQVFVISQQLGERSSNR